MSLAIIVALTTRLIFRYRVSRDSKNDIQGPVLTALVANPISTMGKKSSAGAGARSKPLPTITPATFEGIHLHSYSSLPILRHGPTPVNPTYKERRKLKRATQGKRESDKRRHIEEMVATAIKNKSKPRTSPFSGQANLT